MRMAWQVAIMKCLESGYHDVLEMYTFCRRLLSAAFRALFSTRLGRRRFQASRFIREVSQPNAHQVQ